MGARDFNTRSIAKSSRNCRKAGTQRPIHIIDDFSSFDANMQNILMDDASGYGYDQSSQFGQTLHSKKDHVINDLDSEEDSQVQSEHRIDMARSERAAESVKGSIYQKSNSKSRPVAESERGVSFGVKVTTQDSELGKIGNLPNISEKVTKKKMKDKQKGKSNKFQTPSQSLKGSAVSSALYLKKKNGTELQSQKHLPSLQTNLVDKLKNAQDKSDQETILNSEKAKPPLYLRKKE